MKPKELLQHLEKGDRTMYQLTKKPERMTAEATFNELHGMFRQVYSQPISQLGNAMTSLTGTSAGQWQQAQNVQTQGGTIRW